MFASAGLHIVKGTQTKGRWRRRNTLVGYTIGSIESSSPEQIMLEDPRFADDLWALAVSAYEALTCHSPFDAPNPVTSAFKVLREQPARTSTLAASLPPRLDGWFGRALARSAPRRQPRGISPRRAPPVRGPSDAPCRGARSHRWKETHANAFTAERTVTPREAARAAASKSSARRLAATSRRSTETS